MANVAKGSPAEAAGVQVGDVIVGFEGAAVKKSSNLSLIVARTPVGRVVDVTIVRNGQRVSVEVQIGRLGEVAVTDEDGSALGLTVREMARAFTRSPETRDREGVVVTAVESAARRIRRVFGSGT